MIKKKVSEQIKEFDDIMFKKYNIHLTESEKARMRRKNRSLW